jgi:hypothetical protein
MAELEVYKKGLMGSTVQNGTYLARDGKKLTLNFIKVDNVEVFQGDIILRETDPNAITTKAIGTTSLGALWPGGVIPYVIDANAVNKDNIKSAIKYVNENTELTMVPRTDQIGYVKFIKSDGCSSLVGRVGVMQHIRIADWASVGNVVHEITHAAGLWHEQSRADRDSYVTINWSNIEAGKAHNFDKMDIFGFDINSYDYGSLMHYSRDAFGKNTIVPKDPTAVIGQRDKFSELDQLGLLALYAQESAGPFTDIKVISSSGANPAPPDGYIRLRQDLNEGAGGKYIYICLKKGGWENAITHLDVISGNNSGVAPPAGFTKIPQDLNQGSGGKYIYLCYKRQAGMLPITNISLISGSSSSVKNKNAFGYTIINKDLNEGAGGKYIYLCYRIASKACVGDVAVIAGNNDKIQPPAGYIRLNVDLNKGAGGAYIYLCYRQCEPGQDGVSGLAVICGDSANIAAPTGFKKINVDLNTGAGGKYIYLCKKLGKPVIAEVGVVSGSSTSIYPPAGWTRIDVDVNKGAGGDYIYICYRP